MKKNIFLILLISNFTNLKSESGCFEVPEGRITDAIQNQCNEYCQSLNDKDFAYVVANLPVYEKGQKPDDANFRGFCCICEQRRK